MVLLLVIVLGLVAGMVLLVRALLLRGGPAASPVPDIPLVTSTPVPFAERDTDGDGVTDEAEVAAGTDVTNADTDGDGYTDRQELDAGYNPRGLGLLDRDSDGLPDRDEEKLGTDARNADTDGDGYLDGVETQRCYDPRVPSPNDKVAGCPPYPGL